MKMILDLFKKKLLVENAPLFLLVGLCPILMASKTVLSGLVMATAVGFVLLMSCIAISLVRKLIPDGIRLVVYMIIIATFVVIAEILVKAYLPTHYANMGMYISLIASAGIVFTQVDSDASENGVAISAIDGVLTAVTFGVVIVAVAIVREFLGSGTILSLRILDEEYGMSFALSPGGGLMIIGLVCAVVRKLGTAKAGKKEAEK